MMMNLYVAWITFLLGGWPEQLWASSSMLKNWLGGYGSWPRRMLRLGHIAFFGLGIINLAFALTARTLELETELALPSFLLILGQQRCRWFVTCRHTRWCFAICFSYPPCRPSAESQPFYGG